MNRDRTVETILGIALMMVALGLAACPHPVPPPVTPRLYDMAALYPACAAVPDGGALPAYTDVCEGKVTPDNRACVRCPSEHGCLDLVEKIYCVAGTSCDDPLCRTDKVAPRGTGPRTGAPSGR